MTLRKLKFFMGSIDIPLALLSQNNVLASLEIIQYYGNPISPDSIIKMCSTKQKGFMLKIENPNSKLNVDDYIEIVKRCPDSVIHINVNSVQKGVKFRNVVKKVFANS